MFLITFTRSQVNDRFLSFAVKEVKINSLMVTIVTDNFLSKYIPGSNGFSIIESPLVFSPNFGNTIFSQTNYDKDENVLNIFKSTLSGRPIYYHLNSKGEFFCSSHISMLRKAGVPIQENSEMLPEFFVYRYVMPPNTLYKDINHLFTGGQLQIGIFDTKCIIKSLRHYEAPNQSREIKSIIHSSKKIYDCLSESIGELNSCKEDIAVLLSGGIDSSVTTSICKSKFSINESYSTGYPFEEPEFNFEKKYALSAAKALGMNHHYYEPSTQEYLMGFLEAISLAEEPLHHLQSVLLHLLFKKGVPQDKKIIVHGQGAGFSFGNVINYLYRKDKIITKLFSKHPLKEIYISLSKLSGKRGHIQSLNQSTLTYSLFDPRNPIWAWHNFGSERWTCDYFNVTDRDIIERRYDFIKQFDNKSIYDLWSLYSFLGDEDITLPIWSKLGEGNNKILYTPFYDLNVLNYVFSIPWKLKLKKPGNILRKEIARRSNIPEFIITRPKRGFGIRNEFWSEKGGVFEPLVPLASKVFDEKQIRDMQSLDPKKAMTFWNILNYAIWKRLCINNEPLELLVDELKECILQKSSL